MPYARRCSIEHVIEAHLQRRATIEMLLGAKWNKLECHFEKTVYTTHPNGVTSHWTYYYDKNGQEITK